MAFAFEKTSIADVELSSRFIRSATWEGLCGENGSVQEDLIRLMTQLADNEVGLIITGHCYVSPEGKAAPRQMGAFSDDLVPGMKRMADQVHEAGGKIFLQAAHAGGTAAFSLTGIEPVAPSSVEYKKGTPCREMSLEDVERIREDFTAAASRAKSAGFDGVQIHAAHGYLLSQFLTPALNRRKDQYGGGVENRARFLLEIIRSVKKELGEAFPVTVKINSQDYMESGFTVEDMITVCSLLEKEGIEALEMSGGHPMGTYHPVRKAEIEKPEDEVFYRDAAVEFKSKLNIPLAIVGGVRSLDAAQTLLQNKTADFVSLSRPLICEPDLVARWKAGNTAHSRCISCNKCFRPIFRGKGFYCPEFNK